MKKFMTQAMVVVFFCLFSVVHALGAETPNQGEGLTVKNWKGDYIGSVRHVLTDSSTGNIVFVILSLGKEGEKEVAVPVSSFSSYDFENGFLILNVSKDILAAAPEFHASDLKDPAFPEKVYRFYGLAPSWKDGTTESERGS